MAALNDALSACRPSVASTVQELLSALSPMGPDAILLRQCFPSNRLQAQTSLISLVG